MTFGGFDEGRSRERLGGASGEIERAGDPVGFRGFNGGLKGLFKGRD